MTPPAEAAVGDCRGGAAPRLARLRSAAAACHGSPLRHLPLLEHAQGADDVVAEGPRQHVAELLGRCVELARVHEGQVMRPASHTPQQDDDAEQDDISHKRRRTSEDRSQDGSQKPAITGLQLLLGALTLRLLQQALQLGPGM